MSVPFIHVPGPNATITVFIEGNPHLVSMSHQHFDAILEKLMDSDDEGLFDLVASPEAKINSAIEAVGGSDQLVVKNGQAYFRGVQLDNELGRMLVEQSESGRTIPGFMAFAGKVLQSPSKASVDELYGFLRKSHMPICPDGDFLAYKKVRNDYTDCHTGTFDNSPGNVHEMPRFAASDDRHKTCTDGFHFCAHKYLSWFASKTHPDARVVVVKINPADVVAIPSDHDQAKGRTCRYEVISELQGWKEPVLEGSDASKWVTEDEDLDWDSDEDTDDEDWCDLCEESYWSCGC